MVNNGTLSGTAQYGFMLAKDIVNGRARVIRREHVEEEVAIVREMVRLSIEEKLGFKAISDILNERGLRRESRYWVASSILHILRNPVLKGVMVCGREPKTGNPMGQVVEVPTRFSDCSVG